MPKFRKICRRSVNILCGRPLRAAQSNPNPNSVLSPFELKINTPVTPALQTFSAILVFLRLLVFEL